MTVRPATTADLAAIAAIQAACPEAAQWNCADYAKHLCLVADTDGLVTGFLVGREVALGEHEILNLAVDPAHRRKGVARELLKAAIGRRKAWFLEVRESNQAAISFYRAVGFKPSGRREKYYRDPAEAAIVMHLDS